MTSTLDAEPKLRRMPIPVSEPFGRMTIAPATPRPNPAPELALSFTADVQRRGNAAVWAAPVPTSSSELPDPQDFCRAIVQAAVEVVTGDRPASQLTRWLAPDVNAALQRRATLATRLRRVPAQTRPARERRHVVTSIRATTPADGVVEASAVVNDGIRARAVAIRLQGLDGRWRATALEIG